MASPDRDLAEHFGRNLLKARRHALLSQERLGALAGLHRTEIGLLENGKRMARVDTAIRLAGSLMVDPAVLLAGMQWLPAPDVEGFFSLAQEVRGSFSLTPPIEPPPVP